MEKKLSAQFDFEHFGSGVFLGGGDLASRVCHQGTGFFFNRFVFGIFGTGLDFENIQSPTVRDLGRGDGNFNYYNFRNGQVDIDTPRYL